MLSITWLGHKERPEFSFVLRWNVRCKEAVEEHEVSFCRLWTEPLLNSSNAWSNWLLTGGVGSGFSNKIKQVKRQRVTVKKAASRDWVDNLFSRGSYSPQQQRQNTSAQVLNGGHRGHSSVPMSFVQLCVNWLKVFSSVICASIKLC